jgi:hypothetical protein
MEGGDLQVAVSVQPASSGGLRVISSGDKPAQLASQTAPVGVILPPPDIRSIVVRLTLCSVHPPVPLTPVAPRLAGQNRAIRRPQRP